MRPCRGASDVFKSADAEGRQAECSQALFSGRVQHKERLPGQGHLRPVSVTDWQFVTACECRLRLKCEPISKQWGIGQCLFFRISLSPFHPQVIWMAGYIHQQEHMCRQSHVVQLHRWMFYRLWYRLNALLQVLCRSSHSAPPSDLQESWTCTGLSVSMSTTWSSCASTTPMRNCSSTLWLIISELSR